MSPPFIGLTRGLVSMAAAEEVPTGFDWPGVLRPLWHRLDPEAAAIRLGEDSAHVAVCGSLVWPVPQQSSGLPRGRCPECLAHIPRQERRPVFK